MGIGVAVVCCSGCVSTRTRPNGPARVVIERASLEAIRQETIEVFADQSYKVARDETGALVFERAPTQRERSLWGRIGDDQFRMRVKVRFEIFRDVDVLIKADAYVVRGAFDSEQKLEPVTRHPCQALLDRVKKNLAPR